MVRIGFQAKNELCRVVDEAFVYLTSQQTAFEGRSGWHQFLESGKIGHIATAQVLILYKSFDRDVPSVESCLASFDASRREVSWEDSRISGWSYLSSGPPVPCVEPTCWVYIAHEALSVQDRIQSEVHSFLQATQIPSEDGTSWGFTPWTSSRVSPTCMAIRVLSKIGDKELVGEATRWLLAARDSVGLWGPERKSGGTITHTSLAVLALAEAGCSSTNPVLLTAYSFLADRLKEWLAVTKSIQSTKSNVPGFGDVVDVPASPGLAHQPSRIQYYYNPFVLAGLALATNLQSYRSYVEALAIRAIKDWDVKRWKHVRLESGHNMTSWSFYDRMSALECVSQGWATDRKAAILFVLCSNGLALLRIPRAANVVRFMRSEFASLLFIGIAISVIAIVLGYLVFHDIGPREILGSIILGVIGSFIYDRLKS